MEKVLRLTPENETTEKNTGPPIETLGKSFTLMGVENVGGAKPNPRRYDWRVYYDMYEKHQTVNPATRMIATTATNTGYEFVPRVVADDIKDADLNTVRDFFANSRGFMDELNFVYLHLIIFGNAFMYVVPKRNGKPSRLKTLMPWTINVKADKHGDVTGYFQNDPDKPDKLIKYKPHEIIHFRLFNPKDKLYGLSLYEPLKAIVLTDILAENFNRQFFKNGATTGTVFVFNGATEEQLSRMKKYIHEKFVGSENAHLPLVIDGDVQVHNTSPSMQDMGFEEGRSSIRAQILAVLGVPPAKLGYMETANRSNSKEQDKTFRTETILPLQNLVERGLSDQFIRDVLGVDSILFNHSDADVRDRQEQMDLWKSAVQNGLMTINEVRKLMGYSEMDGGDIAFIMSPTGAVPVVDMELYFRLAQPNTDKVPEHFHDDHSDHARGDNGNLNGPNPEEKRQPQTRAVGQAPTTKSVALGMLSSLLTESKTNEQLLRQAWAYAHDLPDEEATKPFITDSLTKAVRTDDELLRLTYVERVEGIIGQLAKGVTSG